jgi:uncharacterized protein (DUF169 family)
MVAGYLRGDRTTVLTPEACVCPGVQYAMGWRPEKATAIADELHARLGMDAAAARALLESVPHLEQAPEAVLVGDDGEADVYVSFAQPEVAMNLVRRWHAVHGGTLRADLSSVMAVCSGAVLAAHLKGCPAVTFGCPESRRAGKLSRDRLVLAVPRDLVEQLAGG